MQAPKFCVNNPPVSLSWEASLTRRSSSVRTYVLWMIADTHSIPKPLPASNALIKFAANANFRHNRTWHWSQLKPLPAIYRPSISWLSKSHTVRVEVAFRQQGLDCKVDVLLGDRSPLDQSILSAGNVGKVSVTMHSWHVIIFLSISPQVVEQSFVWSYYKNIFTWSRLSFLRRNNSKALIHQICTYANIHWNGSLRSWIKD